MFAKRKLVKNKIDEYLLRTHQTPFKSIYVFWLLLSYFNAFFTKRVY